MIQRRGFLAGVGAFFAAPAIIRTPGLLMPVKMLRVDPVLYAITAITITSSGQWVPTLTPYCPPRKPFQLGDLVTLS